MDNPFQYNSPVAGEYYLERRALRDTCETFLRNNIPVMLIGPRRLGKTSFVRNLCAHWEKERVGDALWMEVYNVTSHQEFCLQFLEALRQHQSHASRILKALKRFIPDQAQFKLGPEGFANLTLRWDPENPEQDKQACILAMLASLTNLKSQTCFVIDECQQIAREHMEDNGWLEATLRQSIQGQVGKVSYLLTGSRRDILHAMANDEKRPLYRSCQLIEFPAFGEEFTDWILARFKRAGITCDREAITMLRRAVKDSPNYVQMVCYHLCARGHKNVTLQAVHTELEHVVSQNAYANETLLQTLPKLQARVLCMVALEDGGYYSQLLLEKYEIPSPAHVGQAITALKKRNILEDAEGRGRVSFDDPLFRLWLRRKFAFYRPDLRDQFALLQDV